MRCKAPHNCHLLPSLLTHTHTHIYIDLILFPCSYWHTSTVNRFHKCKFFHIWASPAMPLPCALARLPKSCYSISSFPSSQFLNSYCEYVAHMCHSVGMISCRRVCRQKKIHLLVHDLSAVAASFVSSLKSGREQFCAHSLVFIQFDGKIKQAKKKSEYIWLLHQSMCAVELYS